jgi:hypothetical protein
VKVPYIPERMTGQQAINRILGITACTGEAAWRAFRDAAADGKLTVWMLGADWGPDGRIDRYGEIERFDPKPVPIGYWKQAARSDDFSRMHDLHRYEVSCADVDRLWPTKETNPVEPKPARRRHGRTEAAYWPEVHKLMDDYLEQNGAPEPGDGEQAKLEKQAAEWLCERTDEPPAESTIRDHVKNRIDEYKVKVGADKAGNT